MPSEIELKYTPPTGFLKEMLWEALEIKPWRSEISKTEMHTDYLDTPDEKAKNLDITLRRRYENGKSVLYAKCGRSSIGALSIRGEWSVASEDIQSSAKLLAEVGAPTEELFGRSLEVMATVRFTRHECTVSPSPGFSFSLSYDEGTFGLNHSFSEIEFELIDGECDELVEFAQKLADKFGLLPESRSKYVRALLYR